MLRTAGRWHSLKAHVHMGISCHYCTELQRKVILSVCIKWPMKQAVRGKEVLCWLPPVSPGSYLR